MGTLIPRLVKEMIDDYIRIINLKEWRKGMDEVCGEYKLKCRMVNWWNTLTLYRKNDNDSIYNYRNISKNVINDDLYPFRCDLVYNNNKVVSKISVNY